MCRSTSRPRPGASQEVAYTDIKVIGSGSFGVVVPGSTAVHTRELVGHQEGSPGQEVQGSYGNGIRRFDCT